jgi:hypothetical protein
MDNHITTSPVAFIIFNRLETTRKVFEVIKKVKPRRLFVIADGPRNHKLGEIIACEDVRKLTEQIDWDCEVLRNYSSENLGCKNRIVSGLDWVFQQTDKAIILEDDCLPDISFFKFCDELLEKYEVNEKVRMISGNKVLYNYEPENSYYFSRFVRIWGWATWKRVWQNYDKTIPDWINIKSSDLLPGILKTKNAINYWKTILDEVNSGVIDAWSLQLQLDQFKNDGLTIIPSKNLVINLGFDNSEATNTKGSGGLYRKMKLETISFPLSHPDLVKQNVEADEIEIKLFHKFGFKEKIRRILLKFNIRIK